MSADLRDAWSARILDADDAEDQDILEQLRADARVEFVDRSSDQASTVRSLLPRADPELIAEPMRWAYYPWRRSVVRILGPKAFRAVRLDRNRNLITADEQHRLCGLKIGVIGLSVGHAIAYTLAAEEIGRAHV